MYQIINSENDLKAFLESSKNSTQIFISTKLSGLSEYEINVLKDFLETFFCIHSVSHVALGDIDFAIITNSNIENEEKMSKKDLSYIRIWGYKNGEFLGENMCAEQKDEIEILFKNAIKKDNKESTKLEKLALNYAILLSMDIFADSTKVRT